MLTTAVLALLVLSGCGGGEEVTQVTPAASPSGSLESMGPELREMAITTPPSKLGFTSDADYPTVYGVLVDWPLGDQTATVLAMRDGTASLYTTSTFGMIGGVGHAEVREAAARLVRSAEQFAKAAEPVDSYPYPPEGTAYYYLLTYSGVRRLSGDLDAIEQGSDPTTDLFFAAQDEITELRNVSDNIDGGVQ
jgi:hypothetical protein